MIKRSDTETVSTGASLILAFPDEDSGWVKVKQEKNQEGSTSGEGEDEISFDADNTQKRLRTKGITVVHTNNSLVKTLGGECDDAASEYSDIIDEEEILLPPRSVNTMPSAMPELSSSAPPLQLGERHFRVASCQDSQAFPSILALRAISILKDMQDSKKISSVSYTDAMNDDGLFSVDCIIATMKGLRIHESGTAKSKREAKSLAAAKVHKVLTVTLNEEKLETMDASDASLNEIDEHVVLASSNCSASHATVVQARGGGESESDLASSHIYGEMPSYRDDSTVSSLSHYPSNQSIFISMLKGMQDSKKISSVSYTEAMNGDGLFSVDCIVVSMKGLRILESGTAKTKKEAKSFAAAKVHEALTLSLNQETANLSAASLNEISQRVAYVPSNGSASYSTASHSEEFHGSGENESYVGSSSESFGEMLSCRDDSTVSSSLFPMPTNCISLLKEMKDAKKILSVSYAESKDAAGLYTVVCTAVTIKGSKVTGDGAAISKKVAKFISAAKVYEVLGLEVSATGSAASDDTQDNSLKPTDAPISPGDLDNSISALKELADQNTIESVTYSDAQLSSDGSYSVVCTVIKSSGQEISCSGAAANKKLAKKKAALKVLRAL